MDKSWIHPSLTIALSRIHGKGFLTTRPLRAGEVVFVFGGSLFSKEDIESGKANKRTLMQVDEGLWLGDRSDEPEGDEYYLNHSCDPNLWMKDEVTLVARRNIEHGEEVTMDYSTHFADPNWVMRTPCRCSSPICRGTITGRDWMLERLRESYRGHFSPLLNKRIARNQA